MHRAHPPFTLLVCFCLSPVNNNTQGVHRCKKVTAMLKEEKMGGKKIEDERKESRRVTLLKSITCQFTAVAPWTALYKFPVWHPFLLLPSRLGLRPTDLLPRHILGKLKCRHCARCSLPFLLFIIFFRFWNVWLLFYFFAALESLWGDVNGWGNVSEECFFSVFDVAAAMQRSHMYTHMHTDWLTSMHKGTQMRVYDSKSWVWCVCEWAMDEERGQRAPGEAVYSTDRETEKEETERSLALLIFDWW